MKTINEWLNEYGESHQHPSNELIHWICVPTIFFCVFGILFLIDVPVLGNLSVPASLLLVIYYGWLSRTLWIGMFLFLLLCFRLCIYLFANLQDDTILLLAALFIVAWIGQFYGHKIEGKKPSFLKDLQFLLIGPAWLMEKIYTKIGIKV